MDVLTLKLSPRAITGKKVKQLRRYGVVPVHVYGRKAAPLAMQVESQVLRRVLLRVGANIPLSLDIEGEKGDNICFVREVQRHPVTEDVLHVDFLRVDVSQTTTAEVPIVLRGDAPAVRELGGTLLQPLQSITVESLPMDVPVSFEIDVSALDDFEKGTYVRDISVGAGVTILADPGELVARVAAPRIEVEEVVEEEVGVSEEEAEAAEGEEASTEG